MLEYNTQKEKLVLPEYGRNVQQMVDHCMTIEDREERNRCATAIVDIMRNLFSHQRDMEDFNKRKISGSTPLKDFPERYNGLISDLNEKITNLENALDKKNTEIDNLKKTITSLEADLKASFSAWFGQKMKEFEDTFEKKIN